MSNDEQNEHDDVPEYTGAGAVVEISTESLRITLDFLPNVAASMTIPANVMDQAAVEWLRSRPELATSILVKQVVAEQAHARIVLEGRRATTMTAQGHAITARFSTEAAMASTESRRDILQLQRVTVRYAGELTQTTIDDCIAWFMSQFLEPLPCVFVSKEGVAELSRDLARYCADGDDATKQIVWYRGIWIAVLPNMPMNTLVFNDFSVNP